MKRRFDNGEWGRKNGEGRSGSFPQRAEEMRRTAFEVDALADNARTASVVALKRVRAISHAAPIPDRLFLELKISH